MEVTVRHVGIAGSEARVILQVAASPADLFDRTHRWFVAVLGYRIDRIGPADDPSECDLSGHGSAITIERVAGTADAPHTIRLFVDSPAAYLAAAATRATQLGVGTPGSPPRAKRSRVVERAHSPLSLDAPNGTVIEFHDVRRPLILPAVVSPYPVKSLMRTGGFSPGRAGMLYRDLVPDRCGGRFVASHIRIEEGGPVPDYVHFHRVRFQCIFCYKGRVKVVYEGQGAPFWLEPGDCVMQPPEIRHRVLESTAGLEVIEIGCPAIHDTFAEHAITLPSPGPAQPDRIFGGQRFVRHIAATRAWRPWRPNPGTPGGGPGVFGVWECADTGIADGSDGVASVKVLRPANRTVSDLNPLPGRTPAAKHAGEFLFFFVLTGKVAICTIDNQAADGQPRETRHDLAAGDSLSIPAGLLHTVGWEDCSPDAIDATPSVLEVALPGVLPLELAPEQSQ